MQWKHVPRRHVRVITRQFQFYFILPREYFKR